MVTARRMTNTGAWLDVSRRVPPQQMTDEELRAKICIVRPGECARCTIHDGCKYGTEWIRRGLDERKSGGNP